MIVAPHSAQSLAAFNWVVKCTHVGGLQQTVSKSLMISLPVIVAHIPWRSRTQATLFHCGCRRRTNLHGSGARRLDIPGRIDSCRALLELAVAEGWTPAKKQFSEGLADHAIKREVFADRLDHHGSTSPASIRSAAMHSASSTRLRIS